MFGKFSFNQKEEEIVRKFFVSKEEEYKVLEWLKKHRKKCSEKMVTYCFTPTHIGVSTIVKCDCGKEINITDYSKW